MMTRLSETSIWRQAPLPAILVLLITAGVVMSCARDPRPARAGATPPKRRVIREAPPVLRDTLGAQTTVIGMDPVLVSGYGVVVGLNGTGSGDVPSAIRAILEQEMLRLGVGREAGPLGGITPSEMLNDRNTAVVLVSAVVPPGSPKGTHFDVRIEALLGTATTSLEGGTLYTADLHRGLVRPTAPATRPIAQARGELFLNPFSEPGDQSADLRRTVGRILDGGTAVEPTLVTLELDTPSHTRSRAMAEAINTSFPRERGRPAVAIGRDEETIEINIPRRWNAKADEFIQLLRHTRVDQSFPNRAALRYVRAMKESPELATDLSWCLQALGPVAIPHLRELYTFPEDTPRQAAILAGARLGDMAVRPYIEEMATEGSAGLRPRAVAMLGGLGTDPQINMFLRDLLNDEAFDVRLAAYEALLKRADPWIETRRIDQKFRVDTAPSSYPTVYVTLRGDPKIVLLGSALDVRRPVFTAAWDGRLMLRADADDPDISVFYKDYRSGRSTKGQAGPELIGLIEYLAHLTTPEEPAPGLDMGYSQVVGALSQILESGGIDAVFVSETDRLALDLVRSRQFEIGRERPELASDLEGEEGETATASLNVATPTPPLRSVLPDPAAALDSQEPQPGAKRTYVVPLGPPKKPTDPKRRDR